MGGEIFREKRIVLGSSDGFLRELLVLGNGSVQANESRREFHLRIVASAKANRFLDQCVAIEAVRGIILIAEPLFVGFSKIAAIKKMQSLGLCVRWRGTLSAGGDRNQKLLCDNGIALCVKRSAAQCLHV